MAKKFSKGDVVCWLESRERTGDVEKRTADGDLVWVNWHVQDEETPPSCIKAEDLVLVATAEEVKTHNTFDDLMRRLQEEGCRVEFRGSSFRETRHGFYLSTLLGLSPMTYFVGTDPRTDEFICEVVG